MGDRMLNLRTAVTLLDKSCGVVTAVSAVYESEPWGFESTALFYNIAIGMKSAMPPLALLDCLHRVESDMGRQRCDSTKRYSSRPIDIDILYYGKRVIDGNRLKVPHRYIGERLFVLIPLKEIFPGWRDPVTGLTAAEMIERCADKSALHQIAEW